MNPFSSVLLFFSLVSWAWLTHSWLSGIGLGVLVLLASLQRWSWSLSQQQYFRCADFSAGLIVLFVLDVYWLQPVERGIFLLLQWLPLLFAPLLAAQLFSQRGLVPLSALFFSLRKYPSSDINIVLPYTGMTMLSAGAANVAGWYYFALVGVWLVLALWQQQPQKMMRPVWLLCLALVGVSAYIGQQQLRQLQQVVEDKSVDWLSEWQSDPFKGQTSIGDIGQLKLSSKIEFRVKTNAPILLHQVNFDRYSGKQWFASQREFVHENPNQITQGQALKQLTIIQPLYRETVLALPDGTVSIDGLGDAYLQYTRMGAIKVTPTPGIAKMQIRYNSYRTDMPSPLDLQVPKPHQDWARQVVQQLKLTEYHAEDIPQRLVDHFQANFAYSLYLGQQKDSDLALREFMLQRKAGHCEFFAVASVFLLRAAGVPARLVNGYAVSEYDEKNGWYIVRSRHAHAWAQAYINGRWQNVDATPSRWQSMEAEQDDVWQPIYDAWSNLLFYLKQFPSESLSGLAMGGLVLYLSIRLYRNRRQLKRAPTSQHQPSCSQQGKHSAFYRIELRLLHTPFARQTNESIQDWVQRLGQPELIQLAHLHYQVRFDPHDAEAMMAALDARVQKWEREYEGGQGA